MANSLANLFGRFSADKNSVMFSYRCQLWGLVDSDFWDGITESMAFIVRDIFNRVFVLYYCIHIDIYNVSVKV